MWEVRRGKKVPEKKKWKVEKEEMYNILVCDDDREIVDAIEIYLTQEGYHVLKAYDGMQAILGQINLNGVYNLSIIITY